MLFQRCCRQQRAACRPWPSGRGGARPAPLPTAFLDRLAGVLSCRLLRVNAWHGHCRATIALSAGERGRRPNPHRRRKLPSSLRYPGPQKNIADWREAECCVEHVPAHRRGRLPSGQPKLSGKRTGGEAPLGTRKRAPSLLWTSLLSPTSRTSPTRRAFTPVPPSQPQRSRASAC